MAYAEIVSCVRGYCLYKVIRTYTCNRQEENTTDTFAVAIMDEGIAGGHVPGIISAAVHFFCNDLESQHKLSLETGATLMMSYGL